MRNTRTVSARPVAALASSRHSGFSLIELMIVVAIIGIVASIAYPSYQGYVTDARRTDAQGALTAFTSAMERHYTETGSYLGAGQGGSDTGTPAIFAAEAPVDGSTKYYDLTISDAKRNTYELTATPKGVQSGDGAIRISSTGKREWNKEGAGTWVPWNE